MSLPSKLEQLHKKKVGLLAELLSLCKEEEALNVMVKMFEEKLAVQGTALQPLPQDSVEWSASLEKVLELYSSKHSYGFWHTHACMHPSHTYS